jgi:Bacterial Ig domain
VRRLVAVRLIPPETLLWSSSLRNRIFRSTLLAVVLPVAVVIAATACTSEPITGQAAGLTGSAAAANNSSPAGSPSSSDAPVSKAVIRSTPAANATGASVIDPVVVRAAAGTLQTVVVTNPEGKEVTGALSADGTTWS